MVDDLRGGTLSKEDAGSSIYKSTAREREVQQRYRDLLDQWPVPCELLKVPTREGETFVVACGPPDAPMRRPGQVTRLALLSPGGVGRRKAGILFKAAPLLSRGHRGRRKALTLALGPESRASAPGCATHTSQGPTADAASV